MASELHEERLDTVLRHLLDSGARRVLDLGCGDGELLMRLADHPRFERLVGTDTDEAALRAAREAMGLGIPSRDDRVQVRYGSFDAPDRGLAGFDAAAMVETIEHVAPGRLSRVEQAVFGALDLHTVLVTTPNREYNVIHGLAPGQLRHPGHRFEWERARFREWAHGVASRNGYQVRFFDIGPVHPSRGSTTQMARFDRAALDATLKGAA